MKRLVNGAVTVGTVALVIGVGGPQVLDALRSLDVTTVLAALGLGLVGTAASAGRWVVLARRLGLRLRVGDALARYYEAQFLNLTLPVGVLGDARRGLEHGREDGRLARGVGAVVLERAVGQVVLVTTALVAVAVVPGLPRPSPGVVVLIATLVVLGAVAVLGVLVTRRPGLQMVLADVGRALLDPRAGPAAVGCSLVGTATLVATFWLASRTVGVVAGPGLLVGLALLALLAMALPLGLAGWGPREAAVAAGFAATGLGAGTGVTTAAVYGVLALVGVLPGGALVLVRLRHRRRALATIPAQRRRPAGEVRDAGRPTGVAARADDRAAGAPAGRGG